MLKVCRNYLNKQFMQLHAYYNMRNEYRSVIITLRKVKYEI